MIQLPILTQQTAFTAPSHWFIRWRGLSTGIASCGGGLGGAAFAIVSLYRHLLLNSLFLDSSPLDVAPIPIIHRDRSACRRSPRWEHSIFLDFLGVVDMLTDSGRWLKDCFKIGEWHGLIVSSALSCSSLESYVATPEAEGRADDTASRTDAPLGTDPLDREL